MLLGGHAPANADDEVGVFGADVLVLADDGEGLLLGMLADGAGVDHNEVGLLGGGHDLVAHLLGHARNLFAVGLVLLTPEGQYEAPAVLARLGGMGLVPSADTGRVVLALGKADGGEYILCCHVGSFAKTVFFILYRIFLKLSRQRDEGRRKNTGEESKKICKKSKKMCNPPLFPRDFMV